MKVFYILFLLFFYNTFFAQMSINAGEDTTICVTWNAPGVLLLGGNPTAIGGTAPYTYVWQCNYNYIVGPNVYPLTASDFLSDSTIDNPNLIHTVENPVTFTLTVIDDIGQVLTDTIVVSFSVFNTHLFEYDHNMLVGDSVLFISAPNVNGGTAPLTYLWKPNNGLTDSTSFSNFWLKPVINTSYYPTVTDAVGCVVSGAPFFHVYVGYAGLSEEKEEKIILFPNPTDGKFFLKNEGETIDKLEVFNQNGVLIYKFFNVKNEQIDITQIADGQYTILMQIGNKFVTNVILKTKE
jgi:hypothetical protein